MARRSDGIIGDFVAVVTITSRKNRWILSAAVHPIAASVTQAYPNSAANGGDKGREESGVVGQTIGFQEPWFVNFPTGDEDVKTKFVGLFAAGLVAATMAVPASATLGPHAARCDNGQPSVVVNVTGFRARTGNLRVQIWTANPNSYLQKRQWLTRVDLPVTRSGDMAVCMPVPNSGNYVVSIRHDVNGNGDSDRSDGAGFSGNPSFSVMDMALRRRPSLQRVSFAVGSAPARQRVVLNYLQGSRIGPVASGQ